MGQYLTLTGYDDRQEQFTVLDTFLGPWDSSGRPIDYEELAAYWAHFNNTFLVVSRAGQRDELAALLGPDYLEPERMWQNAAAAAETAVAAHPDDAFAWFNLGASLTELAQRQEDAALYAAAASAFDQARLLGLPPRMAWYQFQPYEAYLGSGRPEEALALATAVMEGSGGWHVEESHYYQARAYEALGENGRARAALRNALQIRPGYAEAQALLERLGP
jgi:tetratricopeptide (TPR) repeat protein